MKGILSEIYVLGTHKLRCVMQTGLVNQLSDMWNLINKTIL